MKKTDITIASYPDRPELLAELWCEKGMWGELRFDEGTGKFVLELFSLDGGFRPVLDLADLELSLANAKRRLLEIQGLASSAQV
ncbi:MAG TPA: hypothetical protein VF306_17805 [Pirellulales bacterium]